MELYGDKKHATNLYGSLMQLVDHGRVKKEGGHPARYELVDIKKEVSRILDIKKIMSVLGKRRPVFTSEADFQLEFAWTLKELYPDFKVRLEYCPEFDRKIHIDILVLTDQREWIPIELKYKTKGCKLHDGEEVFNLANHSAKDINCYLFLKDTKRIEDVRVKTAEFAEGYAIMLTNEPAYLKEPTKKDCYYKEFSLHEGAVKEGIMKWADDASDGTKKGVEDPITLIDSYRIHWNDYSRIDEPSGTFYYTTCRIVRKEESASGR